MNNKRLSLKDKTIIAEKNLYPTIMNAKFNELKNQCKTLMNNQKDSRNYVNEFKKVTNYYTNAPER
jgi:hypothetical protein